MYRLHPGAKADVPFKPHLLLNNHTNPSLGTGLYRSDGIVCVRSFLDCQQMEAIAVVCFLPTDLRHDILSPERSSLPLDNLLINSIFYGILCASS